MKSGSRKDIWPVISAGLNNWSPELLSGLVTLTIPWREEKASLIIEKLSDKGCSLHIGVGSSRWVDKSIDEYAIKDLFAPVKGKLLFNSQLEAAKKMGAKRGIVLIDTDDWNIVSIRSVASTVPVRFMQSVDGIYVIDTSHDLVTLVWPSIYTRVRKVLSRSILTFLRLL
jgi:hypothetical protein